MRTKARRWTRRAALGLLVGGAATTLWGFAIEPARLIVEHTELTLPRWPQGLAGLRVAVLTDLHVGSPHIDLEKLREVVAATNAERPDLVVVLGDLVIDGVVGGTFVEPEAIATELGSLEAPTYAVLGNHDWWNDGTRIIAALESAGLVVVEDAAVRRDDGLWIAGVSDLWTRPADIARALGDVDDDGPVLVITHHPDVFVDIPDRVSLTLAGHTHGGQVDLPIVGPPVVPSKYGARYAAGHVVEDGRHLFVGSGIGTSILPVRLGVVPRIDVLRLWSAAAS